MTRSDLVHELEARYPRLPARSAELLVASVFESMTETLAEGRRIELRGFGVFSVKHREPREGRNPKTGRPIQVPATCVAWFKAAKEMRLRINR